MHLRERGPFKGYYVIPSTFIAACDVTANQDELTDDPDKVDCPFCFKIIEAGRRAMTDRGACPPPLDRHMAETPPILDPCCGSRMWWFNKSNPLAIFGDIRRETITVTDRSHGKEAGTRTLRIDPDVELDFRSLPFPDDTFYLVAFDPPHIARSGKKSWLAAKYGKLGDNWRDDLRAGFAECFRVLKPNGTLVFKWNETHVKLREILPLSPVTPLFGNTSGRQSGTHWIVFMKPEHPPVINCIGSEDDMIILNKDNHWVATLYASCREQAYDFVEAHGKDKLPTVEAWQASLDAFDKQWRSSCEDDE